MFKARNSRVEFFNELKHVHFFSACAINRYEHLQLIETSILDDDLKALTQK